MQQNEASTLDRLSRPADRQSLEQFREFVLKRAGRLPQDVVLKIELVIEELLLNVFNYAYGPEEHGSVEVECGFVKGRGFMLRVKDRGKAFNPLVQPQPNLDAEIEQRRRGGLGILLVKEMSKSQDYRRVNDSNVLEIVFETPA